MSDCLWYKINVCNGGCACDQYLSQGSEKAERIKAEREDKIKAISCNLYYDNKKKGLGEINENTK